MKLYKSNDRYIAVTKYGEWEPKRAGFLWDRDQKVWATTDVLKAAALVNRVGHSQQDIDAMYGVPLPQADDLSDEERATILTHVRLLAGVCDGAIKHDKVGFNGYDAHFGRDLAERESLTQKQAKAAKKMLKKYRKQLEKMNQTVLI